MTAQPVRLTLLTLPKRDYAGLFEIMNSKKGKGGQFGPPFPFFVCGDRREHTLKGHNLQIL